jgi:regulatory protein
MSQEEILTEKAALRLIARAEQCSNGLTRKLEKRKFPPDCVHTVVSRLVELKLVDDKRFATLWLESKLQFTRSPRQLLFSLCRRGVEPKEAEAALKIVLDEDTEFTLLTRYAKKLLRKAKGQKGENTLRFQLKNEGFSRQSISRFMDDDQ